MTTKGRIGISVLVAGVAASGIYVAAARRSAHGKALSIDVQLPDHWETARQGGTLRVGVRGSRASGSGILADEKSGQRIARHGISARLRFVAHHGFLVAIEASGEDHGLTTHRCRNNGSVLSGRGGASNRAW